MNGHRHIYLDAHPAPPRPSSYHGGGHIPADQPEYQGT